jgi:YidC/Oxa1 family membrane protein insertase
MNDIRRTMLWVVFGMSLVMLWDQWQVYNGRNTTFFPSPTPVVSASGAEPSANGVPSSVPQATTVASSADIAKATSSSVPQSGVDSMLHEQVVVKTDVLKVTFDTEGGSVVRTEFLDHVDMIDS